MIWCPQCPRRKHARFGLVTTPRGVVLVLVAHEVFEKSLTAMVKGIRAHRGNESAGAPVLCSRARE